MNLDEQQINDRMMIGLGFWSARDQDTGAEPFQLITGDTTSAEVDASRPYCRWTIETGASQRVASDGSQRQIGIATLQIIAPLGRADHARAIRDQFFDLMRDWRSEDRCLWVYQLSPVVPPSVEDYRINAKVLWQSIR